MTRYVFLGPTLSEVEAQSCCDAVYLPPVAQGDVAALLRHDVSAIAIVDGYYENVPSVWHKEILLALARGIPVLGAGSLGALRAAECAAFGMQGVGEIFGWYRDGLIDADDEVAVRHVLSDRGYRATNVALVNIRATLQAALQNNALDQVSHDLLLAAARQLHYTQRNLGEIATLAARQQGTRQQWLQLLRNHWVDQKRKDAIALLKQLAKLPLHASKQAPTDLTVHMTTKLEDLFDKDAAITWQDGVRITPHMLSDYLRIALPDFPEFEDRALLQTYALHLAHREQIQATAQQQQRLSAILKREIGDLDSWREQHHLTMVEGESFWQAQILISEVFRKFKPTVAQARAWKTRANAADLLRQARLEGSYKAAFQACLAREVHLQHASGDPDSQVSLDLLQRYLIDIHPRYDGQTRDAIAKLLGFADQTAFFYELNRIFQFESLKTTASVS